ncbi:hypothetical protein [Frankia gtarii]|uniref:hypothetical protein n=1 Tax=Frankia gtarii TaxID=2950102 RepID=UPI0021C02E73|nr:hypothetical protein [Frankia gtarii]
MTAPFRQRTDTVPIWRMPLGALLDEVLTVGFRLERLVEPRPVPELAERDPTGYARLCREPAFLTARFGRARTGTGMQSMLDLPVEEGAGGLIDGGFRPPARAAEPPPLWKPDAGWLDFIRDSRCN